MEKVIEFLKRNIKDDDRRYTLYDSIILELDFEDGDALEDCLGLDAAFDDAFGNYYQTEIA